MENQKKYEVNIIESVGTCHNSLFEKLAKNGDLMSIKVLDIIGKEVTIKGYAMCNIETNDKNFNMNYFDTIEYGLISSGSDFFKNSVINYFGEVEKVKIIEIKTKKGKTYKAMPVLSTNEEKKEELKTETEVKQENYDDELPFYKEIKNA